MTLNGPRMMNNYSQLVQTKLASYSERSVERVNLALKIGTTH